MKSQLLSVLTVVGVLGTATAALAVNTDTLGNVDAGVADASTQAPLETTSADVQPVSAPEAVAATPTTPAAPVTISPDGTISSVAVRQPTAQQAPEVASPSAPAVAAPVAPAPVDATTGGSGAAYDEDDEDDDSSYEDHDDEDGEDDD